MVVWSTCSEGFTVFLPHQLQGFVAPAFCLWFFFQKVLYFFNFEGLPWSKIDVLCVTGLYGVVLYSFQYIGSLTLRTTSEKFHPNGLRHTTHKNRSLGDCFWGSLRGVVCISCEEILYGTRPSLEQQQRRPPCFICICIACYKTPALSGIFTQPMAHRACLNQNNIPSRAFGSLWVRSGTCVTWVSYTGFARCN